MNALLGKITHITPKQGPEARPAATSLELRFKPACVLPQRTQVPEWLKDQNLTVVREVVDPREVGYPGDSLVLTPAESARWLYPLTVTPDLAYGRLPETLRLDLRWWKEEKAPEYTVRANGRSRSGPFAKDGEGFTALVETAGFFDFEPRLPVTFEITCDKLKVGCHVLPEDEPGAGKLLLPEGERQRIENAWYALDLMTRSHGGGIAALHEKGRGVDHFRRPEDRIQNTLEHGGHQDRFKNGWQWSDKMDEAALACTGARREGGALRLALEGVVDEGQNLRSSVTYTLYDRIPLILLEREYRFQKGKGKDGDGKEKDEKPREPIDDVRSISLGFRAASLAERHGRSGSRVLCADGERLVVTRCAEVGEFIRHRHWRISDGWALVEHPRRRESMLYLFDREAPPHMATWLGPHAVTLEPFWPFIPARPEESIGYSLALSAGERCGAAVEGGWVACRTRTPGGVRCAAVGRLRDEEAGGDAVFALGGEERKTPLRTVLVPGVGGVLFAMVEFPEGRIDDRFDVTFAGIASRRE